MITFSNEILKVDNVTKNYVLAEEKTAKINFYMIKFVDNQKTKIVDKLEDADLLTSEYIVAKKTPKSATVKLNNSEYKISNIKYTKVGKYFVFKLRIFLKSSATTAEVTFEF